MGHHDSLTATFAELKAQYPHMHDPINRVIASPVEDSFDYIDDDTVFNCIEFTRLQFMAWATQGPLVETLCVTMDEDLVVTTVTHVVMTCMTHGD